MGRQRPTHEEMQAEIKDLSEFARGMFGNPHERYILRMLHRVDMLPDWNGETFEWDSDKVKELLSLAKGAMPMLTRGFVPWRCPTFDVVLYCPRSWRTMSTVCCSCGLRRSGSLAEEEVPAPIDGATLSSLC